MTLHLLCVMIVQVKIRICSSGDRATVSGTVWRGFDSLQMREAVAVLQGQRPFFYVAERGWHGLYPGAYAAIVSLFSVRRNR